MVFSLSSVSPAFSLNHVVFVIVYTTIQEIATSHCICEYVPGVVLNARWALTHRLLTTIVTEVVSPLSKNKFKTYCMPGVEYIECAEVNKAFVDSWLHRVYYLMRGTN